jgi:tetratricopeptide (TPR) repeat protein
MTARPFPLVLVLSLAASLALAGRAGAEPPAPPPLTQALNADARAAYDDARALYAKGDYAGALAGFDRAFTLSADARLLWNMAACDQKLGRYAKAIALIDRYVSSGAPTTDDDRREAARARAALRPFVAAVSITTTPPGVAIAIDGEAVGATPLAGPVLLDAGDHRVRGARRGYHAVERTEHVAAGAEVAWTLDLPRIAVRVVD